MKPLEWNDCYNDSWKGLIVEDAFAHPAKFAPGLIRRILQHGLDKGYWSRGDTLGDPFGGIAGGGIMAGQMGLNWIGVELEEKFCELGNRNIALNRKFFDGADVRLVQGDSRRFAEIVAVQGILTSPPYAEGLGNLPSPRSERLGEEKNIARPDYGSTPGQIGRLPAGELGGIAMSPPYAETAVEKHSSSIDMRKNYETYRASGGGASLEAYSATQAKHSQGYGVSAGQIAALKEGDVDAVVGSPPFAECRTDGGGIAISGETVTNKLGRASLAAAVTSPPFLDARSDTTASIKGGTAPTKHDPEKWGEAAGQIGTLPAGQLNAAVTSPPYAGGGHHADQTGSWGGLASTKGMGTKDVAGYGHTEGQIGQLQVTSDGPETYWTAMKAVYEQCRLALKPGGYMAIVVKDYCKAGKIVPLCDDTMKLLKALGFIEVERIRAMLVKTTTRDGLFGTETRTKERKSFFRRLYEKNGGPRIDLEEVLIVRRAS